jgi:hypothetical protein
MENEHNYLFGYFNDGEQTPAYDPGLDVSCIYCQNKLSYPMKTISLMKDGDIKSYFYRIHSGCYMQMTSEEVIDYESSLIDKI